MAGSVTEVYSEVLAQICLGYSIKHNTALTKDELIDGTGLNSRIVSELRNIVITQRNVNLSNSNWTSGFVQFIRGEVSRNLNWVDAQGRNMQEVRRRFRIGNGYRVYNDKLFGNSPSDNNPYSAFLKANTGAGTDKWNPADIWVMNLAGRTALKRLNRRVQSRSKVSLEYANQFLADQFSHRNIIPISLKKPQSTPHIDIVNSNEFVTRLALGGTNNPTVEYTTGNKDCKINFTIETVELAPGQTARAARRNPSNIRGTVVQGSQKHIRLKYHVDNKKVELEYTQSGYPSRAAAKMGNLGAENFQRIINETSRQGVIALNRIQQNYSDIDVNTSPWFNGRQLGVTKARTQPRLIEPHADRLYDYVNDLWMAINGDNLPQGAFDAPSLWSKARAGELGVSIHSIPNEAVKKRVIQNLYEAAAAISYTTGLNKEEQELEREVGIDPSSRRTRFNASVYVKVY